MSENTRAIIYPRVHTFRGTAAYAIEALFIALAVIFPMAAHALGLPVFVLLPMHWTILLAGLVYGWKAGLLAGAVSPMANFALTGMPIAAVLPLMTVEMAVYGLVAGLLAQKSRLNAFAAIAVTLLAGRAAFAFTALLAGRIEGSLGAFLQNSFAAGLPAAAVQIALLPVIAAGISGALERSKNRR
jgi:niacin transporter